MSSLDPLDAPPEGETKVVKRGLNGILVEHPGFRTAVLGDIDAWVRRVSKAYRRASLLLHLALLRLAEAQAPIPDLMRKNDTFWKHLLLGLPSGEAYDDILQHVTDCEQYVETAVGVNAGDIPDNMLCYAATTLKTAVKNNMAVPLVNRLGKVCQLLSKSHNREVQSHHLLSQTRLSDGLADVAAWPEWAVDFRREVRQRLGLAPPTFIGGNFHKRLTFSTLYGFTRWMTEVARDLSDGRHRAWMLSPVFSVRRAYVRLDVRTCAHLVRRNVKAIAGASAKKATAEQRAAKPGLEHALRHRAHVSRVASAEVSDDKLDDIVVASGLFKRSFLSSKGPGVHRRFDYAISTDGVGVCAQYSRVGIWEDKKAKKKAKKSTKTASKKAKRQAPKSAVVGGLRQLEDYARDLQTLVQLPADQASSSSAASSRPKIVVGVDPGRTNIATVSFVADVPEPLPAGLSSSYSAKRRCWALKRGSYYERGGVNRQDVRQRERLAPLTEYFTSLGSVNAPAGGVAVAEAALGALALDAASDGGTTDGDGAPPPWDGDGTVDIGAEEGIRGALRTTSSHAVVQYLVTYAVHRDAWWEVALRLEESIASFERFRGKMRVVDSFFRDVYADVSRLFPDADIEVAYGHAFKTMAPSGHYELSVPTAATFRSCERIFRGSPVSVTDESNTSRVNFETGAAMHNVYMRRDKNDLFASAAPVPVAPGNADAVRALLLRLRDEGCRRRRCRLPVPVPANSAAPRMRHPEVRGLRFVPETRMLLDRDVCAAQSIARLRVLELVEGGRPAAFIPA